MWSRQLSLSSPTSLRQSLKLRLEPFTRHPLARRPTHEPYDEGSKRAAGLDAPVDWLTARGRASDGLLCGAHAYLRVLLAASRLRRLLVLQLPRLGEILRLVLPRGFLEQLLARQVLQLGGHLHRD